MLTPGLCPLFALTIVGIKACLSTTFSPSSIFRLSTTFEAGISSLRLCVLARETFRAIIILGGDGPAVAGTIVEGVETAGDLIARQLSIDAVERSSCEVGGVLGLSALIDRLSSDREASSAAFSLAARTAGECVGARVSVAAR